MTAIAHPVRRPQRRHPAPHVTKPQRHEAAAAPWPKPIQPSPGQLVLF